MKFYSDNKYLGARKPFDYPEDIHFKNNKYHLSGDELSHNIRHTDADFSELSYHGGTDVYNPNVGFGSLGAYGSFNWKTITLAVAFGVAIYFYNQKKK